MKRVDEYLRHAEGAEAKAEKMSTGLLREQFLDLAKQWRRLAAQARANTRGKDSG
jgi:hypothetical protein